MIFNILLVLISILTENIFNIYFNIDILSPIFTLMSLIIISKNFNSKKNEFLLFSLLTGFVYDLFFTNFYILNALIFFICSIIIYYIFSKFEYNLLNVIIISIVVIIIYNTFIYLILNFFKYTSYNITAFLNILKNYFIINIIYISLLYIVINNTYYKNKL